MNSISLAYDGHQEECGFAMPPQSGLMSALESPEHNAGMYNSQAAYESALSYSAFPGPYHPDYLQKFHNIGESYTFPPPEAPGDREENGINDMRSPKRRRMSTMSADSTSEPPSSSVSTL